MRLMGGNAHPCYRHFNIREQWSLLMHGECQARGFLFKEERHLNTQATIQARAYGNVKKKKKERKAKQALIRFLAKVK